MRVVERAGCFAGLRQSLTRPWDSTCPNDCNSAVSLFVVSPRPASFLHVIGVQQQMCRTSHWSKSGSLSGPSDMRVSCCLLKAGVWRREVGVASRQRGIRGAWPQQHGREALQICRSGSSGELHWGSFCNVALLELSNRRIRIQPLHCDPQVPQIFGNINDELDDRKLSLPVFAAFAGPAKVMRLLKIPVQIKQGLQPPLEGIEALGFGTSKERNKHESRGGERCLHDIHFPHLQGYGTLPLLWNPPHPRTARPGDHQQAPGFEHPWLGACNV